jgi:hypothetical protein
MKKSIIMGMACMIMSLQPLAAQDSLQSNAAVSRSFQENFEGAKNVVWVSLPKSISQAQFYYEGSSWIAFFDYQGKVITSGRRIKSVDHLPLKVKAGLSRTRTRMEKKSGPIEIAHIYEMLEEGATKYFFTLQNSGTVAVISVNSAGTAFTESMKARNLELVTPNDAIARKN